MTSSGILGRMGRSEGIALVVILIIPRIFLSDMVEVINSGAGLGWLVYVITSAVSLAIGIAVIFMQSRFKGDFLDMVEVLLGRKAFYLVGVFYAALFFFNSALLLRQFAENTMLIGLKDSQLNVVIALYAVLSGLVIYFGVEALSRTAYIVLPFAAFWMLVVYMLLVPVYNIYNLAPWQGTGVSKVILNSVLNSGNGIGVFAIAILAPAFQDAATKVNSVLWGSFGAAFLKIISILVFLLVVGVEIGRERTLPFFEMACRIYFERSFQRLEDFTVLLWVNIGAISIGASIFIFLYLSARMLNLPTIRPLIPVSSVIICFLAAIPENIIEVVQTDFKVTQILFGLGLYAIPAILVAAFFRRKIRVRKTYSKKEATND